MAEVLEGYKYKGDDIIFLVKVKDEENGEMLRPFDQTGGSWGYEIDEIEIETKDRQGADYGNVSINVSLEGELVYEDPFIPAIEKAIENKKYVEIYRVDMITNKTKHGTFMISDFELEYETGDFATYNLEAQIFGDVCETELDEIPEGSPSIGGGGCGDDGGNGVEG